MDKLTCTKCHLPLEKERWRMPATPVCRRCQKIQDNKRATVRYMRDKLTKGELYWLTTRGGRTSEDVLLDEDGEKYVFMGNGRGGIKRVYIPHGKISK